MTLASKYRPSKLDEVAGQEHLIGTNGILTNILQKKTTHSFIFYGPPGCGKTTIARILVEIYRTDTPDLHYAKLNATNAALADIRKIIKTWNDSRQPNGVLYLDEIQYFNKKQQQALLPYIESGQMILIASTADNPYYCCYDALLSRCPILEFKPIDKQAMVQRLNDICIDESVNAKTDALLFIAENTAGDMRRAINILDLAISQQTSQSLTKEEIEKVLPDTRMAGFDTDGDIHFALISALQKSIRGSDPDAAVFYLARLLEGGDILSPCRRLAVIAHEDIGLGNPEAVPFTYACIEMAKQLGLPEAAKPLTNAVLYLALSPKSSTCENTYNRALEDVKAGNGNDIPYYLRHACGKGYLYPHDYPNHWVNQQYLPDDIKHKHYYQPDWNTFENSMQQYWSQIKK